MTKNELITKVLNMIDYFQYHNKNLTKEQWQKISELYHFILEPKKGGQIMKTAEDFLDIRLDLNSAIDTLEDIFGDYEEIADAMERLNKVVDFLYEAEQEKRKEQENDK